MINHSYFSGKKNIDSMKIEYKAKDGIIEGVFIPKPTHVSYSDVVHGGLIAALLDDAMAYAINCNDVVAYTGKFEIRYKNPLDVGMKYYISAKIDSQRKKYITTSGEIRDRKGKLYAKAGAIFIIPK